MAWLGRINFQLSTQLRDVDVDRSRHDFHAMTPHLPQQLDARRHRPAAANQGQQ
jgi:hypothetical protein